MKAVAKTVEPAEREAKLDHIQPLYLEALTLVERLHRRLLDVIKDEFDRRGRADINSVQALLLYNVGDKELTAGELRTRGYYLGSNVSYNLKKLVEMGFLDHQRSRVDRRSVRIKLTDKGQEVRNIVEALYQKHVRTVEQVGGISSDEFVTLNKSLHRLERFWTDQILVSLVTGIGWRKLQPWLRLGLFRLGRPQNRPPQPLTRYHLFRRRGTPPARSPGRRGELECSPHSRQFNPTTPWPNLTFRSDEPLNRRSFLRRLGQGAASAAATTPWLRAGRGRRYDAAGADRPEPARRFRPRLRFRFPHHPHAPGLAADARTLHRADHRTGDPTLRGYCRGAAAGRRCRNRTGFGWASATPM